MGAVIGVINWDAVSSIISILGFVAVLLTLAEMKSQRKHSYKPVLAIKKPYFVIQNNPQGIPSMWKEKFDDEGHEGELWIDLELTDIGFGTANEIEINWGIDTGKMVTNIDSENSKDIYKKTDISERVHYTYNNYGFTIDKESTDTKQELGHLTSGSSMKIRLPMTVKNYISFYYLAKTKNQKWNIDEKGIVPLRIKTKCIDISGKEIHQEILMKYDLFVKKDEIDKPHANIVFGRLYFIGTKGYNIKMIVRR